MFIIENERKVLNMNKLSLLNKEALMVSILLLLCVCNVNLLATNKRMSSLRMGILSVAIEYPEEASIGDDITIRVILTPQLMISIPDKGNLTEAYIRVYELILNVYQGNYRIYRKVLTRKEVFSVLVSNEEIKPEIFEKNVTITVRREGDLSILLFVRYSYVFRYTNGSISDSYYGSISTYITRIGESKPMVNEEELRKLQEELNLLQINYTRLKNDYNKILVSYQQLKKDYNDLVKEYNSLMYKYNNLLATLTQGKPLLEKIPFFYKIAIFALLGIITVGLLMVIRYNIKAKRV